MATKPHPSASLYVGDLSGDATEGMLFETFNRVGPVASIRVCRDTLTRRSLGYAYVNFHSVVDAERALDTLNNQTIRGRPCRIMWSQRDPSIRKSGIGNIFIKNLDPNIGHKELYDTFSAFGNILSCKVAMDETGQSKGFGFVHFETSEAADGAIKMVNEKLLGTKKVFVGKFVPKKERLKLKESSWTNVYVKDIDLDVNEDDLFQKFGEYGKITSAVVMRNPDGTSRGFGFVNFDKHEDALKAVEALQGQNLGAKKLWCGRAQKKNEREAELKRRFQQQKLERISRYQGINLYIKNLEDEIDETRLKQEFSAFGTIKSAKIMLDERGNSKGFGFICYNSPEEAQRAINEMNSRILQGFSKPLYVALHEPKEVRRTKLAQRHAARKIRTGNVPQGAPAAIPYTQGVFYGNGNVPGFVYGPPPQQQLISRTRGAPATWPQTPPYPAQPNFAVPGPGRGGRNVAPARAGGPAPGRGGRGGSVRRNQMGQSPQQESHINDPNFQQLMQLPSEQQKLFLGEQLYPLILPIQPVLCGKITGMLLDSDWSVDDLYSLLVDEAKLQAKIDEAVLVLERAQQAGEPGAQDGGDVAASHE